MSVCYELPRLTAGLGETQVVNNVVQSSLQEHKEVLSRVSFLPFGSFDIDPELPVEDAVSTLEFLRFTQLEAIL